eukprot:gene12172-5662_t
MRDTYNRIVAQEEYRACVDFDPEDVKEIQKMIQKIKLAKFFVSNYFIILITIPFVICIILLQVAVNGLMEILRFPASCTFSNYPAANAVGILATPFIVLFLVVFNITLITIDFILFTKENGFSIKGYFLLDNPFCFRIEFLVDLFVTMFAGLISFLPLIFFVINQRTNSDETSDTAGQIRSLILVLLLFLFELLMILALNGMPLIILFVNKIKR